MKTDIYVKSISKRLDNLLRGSIYEQIHDTRGSKFFSFSNIFPHADLKQGDIRTFIISSPDDEFVRYLFDILLISARRETTVNIGHMKFKISYLKKIYTIHTMSGIIYYMKNTSPLIHEQRTRNFGASIALFRITL